MRQIQIISGKITTYNEASFKAYMQEISKIPIMSDEEEFKVAMEAKNGNADAMEYLITANLRFVISVAKQYTDTNTRIEDIVNEGNLGLITAAQRFDPTRGFKFISYAVWWIRRGIQEFKDGAGGMIRKPSNRVADLHKYREVKTKLGMKLEREPTKEEIINSVTGEDKEKLEFVANLDTQEVCSLDKELGDDGFTLKDSIYSNDKTDNNLGGEDVSFKMGSLLSKLTDRERSVIEMSYGLTGEQFMSLQDIGDTLGVTREAIRLIRNKALGKLKVIAKTHNINFDDFVNGK